MSNFNSYKWSSVNRFGVQIITFIGNILIARILTPDDYGLVGMLAIIIAIAWNFTDSGFSDCLIRKKDADKYDFGTVFTFNIAVGVLMYFVIFVSAPYIAQFFNRIELVAISKIIGLSILIKAITVVEFTRLRKELNFKTTTFVEITSNLLAVISAYVLAINGFGYWSLVLQTLLIGLFNIILLLFCTKWKPFIYFSWKRFKVMSSYSFNLLITYFINQIGNNIYSVIIGKYQTANILGLYRQAQKMRDVPIMSINAIILNTSYPLLANETDDHKRFNMYLSIFNKFFFVHFLIVSVLFGISFPLIDIILGEKWISITPFFQLMLIASAFLPIDTINSNIARVHGRANLLRNNMFLKITVSLTILAITMNMSIYYILYGQILASYISVIINSATCGRLINFGIRKQFALAIKQALIPIFSVLIAYLFSFHIDNSYYRIVIFIFTYIPIYTIFNKRFKITEFKLIEDIIAKIHLKYLNSI